MSQRPKGFIDVRTTAIIELVVVITGVLMSENYKPTGCASVLGVISIIFGVVLLFTTFPVGLIPAAGFIGGGFRLLTGVGNL